MYICLDFLVTELTTYVQPYFKFTILAVKVEHFYTFLIKK